MTEFNVPEGEDETYYLLNQGLALYNAGHPYEAHEVWEYAWGAEVGRSKLTLQALIQIAAALHKHNTGQPRGTCKLMAKAKDKLDDARSGASAWLGIDLVALTKDVERALAAADAINAGAAVTLVPPRLPAVSGKDGVLYLHGFASGPSSAKANELVPALRADGLHVDVPDLNEDDFTGLTVSRALARARRCLRDRTLLIGSSLGGYVAALLAASDERVKALVLMAPAFDFAKRLAERHGPEQMATWERLSAIEVDHHVYGKKVPIGWSLYEDGLRHPGRPPIRCPAYVLQGSRDDVVSPELVADVVQGHPHVTFERVDDDHGLVASAPKVLVAARRLAAEIGLEPDPPPSDASAVLASWPS